MSCQGDAESIVDAAHRGKQACKQAFALSCKDQKARHYFYSRSEVHHMGSSTTPVKGVFSKIRGEIT